MDDVPFKATTLQKMKNEFDEVVDGYEYLTTSNCGYSQELCDFVNGLLEKDNMNRLGRCGIDDIKAHKFFGKEFNWKYLELRQMKCPFVVREFKYNNINANTSNNNSQGSGYCFSEGSVTTNDNSPKGNCDINSDNDNCFRKYTFIRKIVRKGYKHIVMQYRTIRHESIDASYHNKGNSINNNNESNVNMNIYKSTLCSPVKGSVNKNMLTKLTVKGNPIKAIMQKMNNSSSVPRLPLLNKTRNNNKSNIKNDIILISLHSNTLFCVLCSAINISITTISVCIPCKYMFIKYSLNVIALTMKCGPKNISNQNRIVIAIESDVDIGDNL
jgi:hypothetical protein